MQVRTYITGNPSAATNSASSTTSPAVTANSTVGTASGTTATIISVLTMKEPPLAQQGGFLPTSRETFPSTRYSHHITGRCTINSGDACAFPTPQTHVDYDSHFSAPGNVLVYVFNPIKIRQFELTYIFTPIPALLIRVLFAGRPPKESLGIRTP